MPSQAEIQRYIRGGVGGARYLRPPCWRLKGISVSNIKSQVQVKRQLPFKLGAVLASQHKRKHYSPNTEVREAAATKAKFPIPHNCTKLKFCNKNLVIETPSKKSFNHGWKVLTLRWGGFSDLSIPRKPRKRKNTIHDKRKPRALHCSGEAPANYICALLKF